LWVFDPVIMQWAFLGGSSTTVTTKQYYYYGTKGVTSKLNWPIFRHGGFSWTFNDTTYMMGGEIDFNNGILNFFFKSLHVAANDLWKWENATWTWIAGSQPNATYRGAEYGDEAHWSAANFMSPRAFAAPWIRDNNLWLYGGLGYGVNTTGNALRVNKVNEKGRLMIVGVLIWV
jgi:hypothetical protein